MGHEGVKWVLGWHVESSGCLGLHEEIRLVTLNQGKTCKWDIGVKWVPWVACENTIRCFSNKLMLIKDYLT